MCSLPCVDIGDCLVISSDVQLFVQNLVQNQLPKESLSIMARVGCSLAKQARLDLGTFSTCSNTRTASLADKARKVAGEENAATE